MFAASSKDAPQERNTPEHRPAATLAALASFAGLRACANTSPELLAVPVVISDGHKGDGGDFLARTVADEPVVENEGPAGGPECRWLADGPQDQALPTCTTKLAPIRQHG